MFAYRLFTVTTDGDLKVGKMKNATTHCKTQEQAETLERYTIPLLENTIDNHSNTVSTGALVYHTEQELR